ncbi:transposase [Stigmatella aurantiaca DW4/3-1]|uniref:Transposase n=1 Tax=Stigmatella aurantiaca (strain DW4/3-1) TaxID=378806 RepID=E3FFJ5_STIAD|nr:transposase [Stigmatella aurantiaca DW4/3-1]
MFERAEVRSSNLEVAQCPRFFRLPFVGTGTRWRRVPRSPAFTHCRTGKEGAAPRVDWAGLLRRTFALEVFCCPRCGGRRRVLAYLMGRQAVRAILEHLALPWQPPRLAPAQGPPRARGGGESPPAGAKARQPAAEFPWEHGVGRGVSEGAARPLHRPDASAWGPPPAALLPRSAPGRTLQQRTPPSYRRLYGSRGPTNWYRKANSSAWRIMTSRSGGRDECP